MTRYTFGTPDPEAPGPIRVDQPALEAIAKTLLLAIGEDPTRDGLVGTPARFARWWAEFIDYDAGDVTTTFSVDRVDEMVVVSGIEVWSLCEHHLLPFRCIVAIGYLAEGDRVLGLSKFARIAHHAAHRLQVQERLTDDIADGITDATGSPHVAVIADGEHLCMTIRGIRTPARMTTSVTRGAFRAKPAARAEFIELARRPE